ncbi:hydrolase [Pectinatus frisingensis]|jgi:predicted hydrolase (HD superfamily)|uniref:hydrolase n=1 Tax=Pectinatus frisingensis TaxID=865 RepID=UPI0018C5949E|nr:hydrolase [Pectinatus frisingensis]
MQTKITWQQAWTHLQKYNQENFHRVHAVTVSAVMRWYAQQLDYTDEADFWEIVGLLHDIDFEKYPELHCQKAPEILSQINAEPELIHAVCSHGYGICSDIKPTHQMEKVLFACDELTGLIGAAALMRPSKSVQDMELKSLKKKFKDKKFAAGCSRDIIKQGAQMLDWSLDDLLEKTLSAMRDKEAYIKNTIQ